MIIWKPIKGYEEHYDISTIGVVRKRGSHKEVAQHKDERGYMRVRLNGKQHRVHRLVALNFIPNPHEKKQVIHKDLNRLNNWEGNLQWATLEESIMPWEPDGRSKCNGRQGNNFVSRSRAVLCYSLEGELVGTYPSINAASRATGASAGNIHGALIGRMASCNKLVWKFVEDVKPHGEAVMQ